MPRTRAGRYGIPCSTIPVPGAPSLPPRRPSTMGTSSRKVVDQAGELRRLLSGNLVKHHGETAAIQGRAPLAHGAPAQRPDESRTCVRQPLSSSRKATAWAVRRVEARTEWCGRGRSRGNADVPPASRRRCSRVSSGPATSSTLRKGIRDHLAGRRAGARGARRHPASQTRGELHRDTVSQVVMGDCGPSD